MPCVCRQVGLWGGGASYRARVPHLTFHQLHANFKRAQVNAAVAEKVDWAAQAKDLDTKSPLEIMDHVRRHAAMPCMRNVKVLRVHAHARCFRHCRP